jgi:hypothetical protein
MGNNEDSNAVIITVFFILIILFFSAAIGGGCWYNGYGICNGCNRIPCTCDNFESFTNKKEIVSNRLYNPLYTSPNMKALGSFYYTQPPGDRAAENFAGVNQGTNGGFFPIHGRATGVFMNMSSPDNLALPSQNVGKIGALPNYTKQEMSSRWSGFNNFGSPFSLQKGPAVNNDNFSNSYLIDGGNQRVTNSGQKGKLPCQNWWPHVQKGSHEFCTQGSDAMVPCKSTNVNSCKGQGGQRFLRDKMGARWKKVINP